MDILMKENFDSIHGAKGYFVERKQIKSDPIH